MALLVRYVGAPSVVAAPEVGTSFLNGVLASGSRDPHDRADASLDVVEGEEEIGSPN
jgi:hypothetical protein